VAPDSQIGKLYFAKYLGTAKEIAQLGATIGRKFSYDLIHALVPDEVMLQRGLTQLVDAGLVYQRGAPPRARYSFKHALVQNAAYNALLRSKRRQIHLQIAHMLEQRFSELVDTRPELLAHHYTQAEQPRLAIPHWQQAGTLASDRAAHVEAIQHFSTALALVDRLPADAARDRLELTLQVSLGLSLAAGKGYAAPEGERTYNRARELCRSLGETAELFPILRGLWAFYVVLDNQKVARELAEQCLRLAQESEQVAYLIEGHTALGYSLYYAGELEASQTMLEHGVTLYELHHDHAAPLLTPQDPGVACLSLLSWVLWLRGYPAQSLRRSRDAIALAQRLEHPFHTGFAHSYSAMLHVFRREPQLIEDYGRSTVRIGTEHALDVWSTIGIPYIGIAKVLQGETAEGIDILTQSLATWRAVGIELNRPCLLGTLTEAYRAVNQRENAMEAVDEALAHAERHGEHFYLPALYHLRGELLLG
jgi:predicted ATPase